VNHLKIIVCSLVLLSCSSYANANTHSGQISSTIRLKILPDKVAEFEGLVAQLVRDVYTHESGAQVYEVRRVKNQPLTYVYFLSFEDQAAYDRYAAAEWHTQMSPMAVACLDGDPIFEDLESFY